MVYLKSGKCFKIRQGGVMSKKQNKSDIKANNAASAADNIRHFSIIEKISDPQIKLAKHQSVKLFEGETA